VRIVLIHQAFVPLESGGGTRHYEFAQHLIGNGDDVVIVASDTSYLTGERISDTTGLVSKETFDGLIVFRARTCFSLHRSFVRRVLSFTSFMVTSVVAGVRAGKMDLVIGTSPPIFQAVSAWLLAALRRRPFLLEVRDLWPEFAIGMGVLRNPFLIRLSRWLEGFLYNRADHLVVNSPAYRDYLIARGMNSEKVSLVANGADPAMFDPEARGDSFRERWNFGNDFVVTYAGALGAVNDIPVVLRAADRLRGHLNIRFVLVGDGKERRNLESMAEELELENVVFTGVVAKLEMTEVLAASDACLSTLKNISMFRTTYPNKVFDYMAAGRPVILVIDGVIREVVERVDAGVFVPPGDDEALAGVIRQLAEQPDLARKMGGRGRHEVVKNFNRNDQAGEFLNLVHRVAGRHAG